MGRHATAERTRRFARWIHVTVIVAVCLLIFGIVYWFVVGRADSARDGACVEAVSLVIAAGPSGAAAVDEAAAAFNKTAPVARSACVTATVTAVDDDVVLRGLVGSWPLSAGPAPGLWIPDNAASVAALDALDPALAAGHPTVPVAWSPMVLAVRDADVSKLTDLGWGDLPEASGPKGGTTLSGDQPLVLAMPPVTSGPASSYLVQSILAAPPREKAPVTPEDVAAGSKTIATVIEGADSSASSTAAALKSLQAGEATATAVPVTEADLVAFDHAGGTLAAAHLRGPTVGDALIATPISSASWTTRTTTSAAAAFQSFLSESAGQQILADHGWRTMGAAPAEPLSRVDTSVTVDGLAAAGPNVRSAIAAAMGEDIAPLVPAPTTTPAPTTPTTAPPPTTPAETSTTAPTTPTESTEPSTEPSTSAPTTEPVTDGPILTIIIDVSRGMAPGGADGEDDGTDDGDTNADEPTGESRLDWVKDALPSILDGSITDRVGLWAFSDAQELPPNGYPQLVTTGPLDGTVDDTTRADALTAALKDLHAGGDRWAYGALIEALKTAPDTAVDGRENRILLITSGVDETPGTLRRDVLSAIDATNDTVRIDVIGLGDAVPVEHYSDIATMADGTYVPVTDPSTLAKAIKNLYTEE